MTDRKATATSSRVVSRRAEYAEATRQAAVDAARRLFRDKGYFATTVNEIAAEARVSPATVYAVNGGKQGLLRTLIDVWSAAPVVAVAAEHIAGLDDPAEILRYLTALTRQMRQDYGDIMRVVIAAAPHDSTAAEGLALGTRRYREGNGIAARRIAELGGLRDGMDAAAALDIMWFYLGYAGFFTLVDDNGWSYAKAEEWLCHTVSQAVLKPHDD
ncbi:TetR/AcrR family transcriptional regulator [Mycobacterium montefiorense]|uniref:TetR/AcrR family transcriptional regulator n=1 Tax=Mycobacterium montefiorense TaxID=154654 RepID=UPI0021DC7446|nr:TetR/AcrR family transcriptional regulator [Mycobacterium montefiorense]MCV7427251.1 TetR/AcrR family transcriptional regulator [Mycobacterium montefiorense]GLE54205.1 TetR family transcriptional regulator [Mycobacterium montefiorense]